MKKATKAENARFKRYFISNCYIHRVNRWSKLFKFLPEYINDNVATAYSYGYSGSYKKFGKITLRFNTTYYGLIEFDLTIQEINNLSKSDERISLDIDRRTIDKLKANKQ